MSQELCLSCTSPFFVGDKEITARRVRCPACGAAYDVVPRLPSDGAMRVSGDLALALDEARPPPMLADVSGAGATRAVDVLDLAPMRPREKLARAGVWAGTMVSLFMAIYLVMHGIPGVATYYALMGIGVLLAVALAAPPRYRSRRILLDAERVREVHGERVLVQAPLAAIADIEAREDGIELRLTSGRSLLLAAGTKLTADDLGWLARHLRRGLALHRAPSEIAGATVPRLGDGRNQGGSGTSR